MILGWLRKCVYEELVKCLFRGLGEHRVRTDETRQSIESQSVETNMLSGLRRSNPIYRLEKLQ